LLGRLSGGTRHPRPLPAVEVQPEAPPAVVRKRRAPQPA
jgi:hypothetical protein